MPLGLSRRAFEGLRCRALEKVYAVVREVLRCTLGLRRTFEKVYIVIHSRRFTLSFEKGYVVH